MKTFIKRLAAACLAAPVIGVQKLIGLLGIQYFLQGDVFDLLLETKTTTRLPNGESLIFHTPNHLTRFRARTLLTKEPETIEWMDKFHEGAVFWDVGANVGLYSLYAGKTHPDIKIFSFEPSIENTYLLNRNISENVLQQKIFAFPFALSERSGPNLFQHIKIQLGGAINSFGVDYSYDGKPATFTQKYRVFGFRADDLESVFSIPQPNYIKIDVDGIEHLIARGARRVLSDPRLKSVLIELNLQFSDQRNEILQLFGECGLVLSEYKHADAFYGAGSFSGIYNHIFLRNVPRG